MHWCCTVAFVVVVHLTHILHFFFMKSQDGQVELGA